MRSACFQRLAPTNKCLARSNKSGGRAETTKGRPTEGPRHVELPETYRPNRSRDPSCGLCLKDLPPSIAPNRKGSERLLRMQERDKRQGNGSLSVLVRRHGANAPQGD